MRSPYAVALVLVLAAPATAQEPQALFKKKLLADAKTSSDVKSMLRSGRGFVEPAPVFADVTGDSKSDALVRVMTGGAAGAVAVYVLSTDGTTGSELKRRDAQPAPVPRDAQGQQRPQPRRARAGLRRRRHAVLPVARARPHVRLEREGQADAARLDGRVPARVI